MPLTTPEYLRSYETMRLIREFEESLVRMHGEARVPGFVHVSVWQEAVSTGVSLWLRTDDLMITTHRGHGDIIAKGASIERMYAELLARAPGYCRAKGGSMHVTDVALGVLGANGIVGANLPIGTGAALSMKKQGRDSIVVVYTGDGAIAQGATHEALNMAALWQLPVVYVRTDNQYAESTSASAYRGMPDVVRFIEGYGIAARAVDGNDVGAVADAARWAIERSRAGAGPSFLTCSTYRRYGHNTADVGAYRTPEEVAAWQARDPLTLARARLVADRGVAEAEIDAIDARVRDRIQAAIAWADAQPEPPLEWAFEDLYADPATLAAFGGSIR
jgi:TPP-dependent pyruvate/acetoin dehydrogenase alpha subunit